MRENCESSDLIYLTIDDLVIPDEYAEYAQLELELNNIREKSSSEILSFIEENFKTKEEIRTVTIFILSYTKTMPLYMDNFCDLILGLTRYHPEIKDLVYRRVFGKFLRKLYVKGYFTLEEVELLCKSNIQTYQYFAPELGLPDEFLNLRRNYQIKRNINKLMKDDWKIYREVLEYDWPINSVEYLIRCDSVRDLILKIDSNYNFDTVYTLHYLIERFQPKLTMTELAAYYGSLNCFKYIIERAKNLDNTLSSTVIHSGSVEMLSMAAKKDVDMTLALSSAIKHHQNDVFDWLKLNYACRESNMVFATQAHNLHVLFYYILNNFNVNEAVAGYTPLLMATKNDDLFFFSILMKYGADINSVLPNKTNVLQLSVEFNSIDIFNYIVENHINDFDIDYTNNSMQTALHICSSTGNYYIAKKLIDMGANVNKKDNQQRIALHIAAEHGYTDIVDLLVVNNSHIDEVDSSKETPMRKAVNRRRIDVVRTLLKNKADINIKSFDGLTPFTAAEKSNNPQILELMSSFNNR